MSYHDEPIYSYKGRPCRVMSIYMGADGRQYHLLDTGPVPSQEFFEKGQPLDGISIHDFLSVSSLAIARATDGWLADISGILLPFTRDGESVFNTLDRMVSEFNSLTLSQSLCWNCGSQDVFQTDVCPACGKQLRVDSAPLATYPVDAQSNPVAKIISTLYTYISHPGGLKWVTPDDVLKKTHWIQSRWLGNYHQKLQCWNCAALVPIEAPVREDCASCGKHLGFRARSSYDIREKVTQILVNDDKYSDDKMVDKLEQELGLEPPIQENWGLVSYARQLKEILGIELTNQEERQLDGLYESRWWGLNRRD